LALSFNGQRQDFEVLTFVPYPPVKLSSSITAVARRLDSGADCKEVKGAVENLISLVQGSEHPDRHKITAVLDGVIDHLDRSVTSSARALLVLAARMAA
jgi:hypothetical protein